MENEFFADDQNLDELVGHMSEVDQRRFRKYGHFRVEAAFINRTFVVYRARGSATGGLHKDPEILATVKVNDFSVVPNKGCYAVLEDQKFQQELTISHVPQRLFNYPIYISIPPRVTLRWDCRIVKNSLQRSLSFAMLIKTKNKSEFHSKGNIYAETPNEFRRLYPNFAGSF